MNPRALNRSSTNDESRWEEGPVPCGRVGALLTLEPRLQGLSTWRHPTPSSQPQPARSRRGRGLSPPIPTTPPQPAGSGRSRDLSPPSPPTPPPLEDHSHPQSVISPVHPYTVCDPNTPHITMTYSLPNMPLFASSNGSGIAVLAITAFPLKPYSRNLLPYSPHVPSLSESADSDVPLPDPFGYDADVEWD